MQTLSDMRLLRGLMDRWGIRDRFDTEGLDFRLVRFEKGELLVAPFRPMDTLYFLVRGRVNIYGLREDGSSFSVYLADQGVLLGDIEFVKREALPFYTEAHEEVLCVALAMEPHRAALTRDVRFLNFLLESVAEKFRLFTLLGQPAQPVEEKLVTFLRDIRPDHTLHGMNAGVMQLNCSRSQLQRVVRKLCAEGVLVKSGKGKYRLRAAAPNDAERRLG